MSRALACTHSYDPNVACEQSGRKAELDRICTEVDAGRLDSLELDEISDDTTHAVAATLKKFLRDLPEPLVTFAAIDQFMQVPGTQRWRTTGALWLGTDVADTRAGAHAQHYRRSSSCRGSRSWSSALSLEPTELCCSACASSCTRFSSTPRTTR